MDGLILAFKNYMFTWIFSPPSLLWRHWLSKSCYDIIDYQNLKHHNMFFVLTQRGGKYGYSITESRCFSVFLFTWHMYALLLLQLWHMIVLLIILIMAWWYHFWHVKFLKVSIYFILKSEINAYLQWIKVTSEMILYQFSSEWYDLCFHCSENLKILGTNAF